MNTVTAIVRYVLLGAAGPLNMVGDVEGTTAANTIKSLQKIPVDASAPKPRQVLISEGDVPRVLAALGEQPVPVLDEDPPE